MTTKGAEIDLVIKHPSSEIWAIEIKHGHSPKLGKHYNQTCKDLKATKKYIVYGGDDEFPIGEGVTVISLSRFMQKLQLLLTSNTLKNRLLSGYFLTKIL